MDKELYTRLAKNVNNGPTPYVNDAGLVAEVVEERHVRLTLPLTARHRNHLGIAYAGSEFVLAEIAGGTLFMATYGTKDFVPVLKSVESTFVKPGTSDLTVDISLSGEEAQDKIKPIKERGRGDFFLDVPIIDSDGEQVALMKFNYYALPPKE
jgi:acyl-coenzyme A thioesterase PaaI-like protein